VTAPDTETELFLRYLQAQRDHLLSALDGLDEAALRTATLPSGWTPLGLVSHLTHDVELFWFAGAVAGDPEQTALIESGAGDDGWRPDPSVPAADVLAAYRAATARSDAVVRAVDLDAPPAWWPVAVFGEGWRLQNVREVLLHVLVETAAHAGQMDAARELVDGRQWLVLD
jgi:hypothetical protein